MNRKKWNFLLIVLMLIVIVKLLGVGRLMITLKDSNQQVDHRATGGAALKPIPPDN